MNNRFTRRHIIKNVALSALSFTAVSSLPAMASHKSAMFSRLKGNIRHSVCRWCFDSLSVEELCKAVKRIGFGAIDLVGPKDWEVLKRHSIDSSMCNGAEINLVDGWNDKKFHATLIKNYTEMIPLVAKAGYTNLICFSGNRRGMDDETGWKNCTEGLQQIMSLAEQHGVVLHMELLNSRVNHIDYMCSKTTWGVELCKRIGSLNFRLLYDIYHMQIDEGDVIRTIQDNHQYLGHYHTAGVPGRHEIEEDQELNYPAIMRAIAATGFKGYVAQEFIPTREDKFKSLKKAIRICDI